MEQVKRKADAKVRRAAKAVVATRALASARVEDEMARTRFHRGKAAAAKSAAQAAKGAARTYRRRINENARTVDNVMRLATLHLGADTVSEVVRRAYNA